MIKKKYRNFFLVFVSIIFVFSFLFCVLFNNVNQKYPSYASYELDNGVYHINFSSDYGIVSQNGLKEPTNIIKYHDGTTLDLPYYKTMPDFLFDSYYNYGANPNVEYGEQEEYWGTLYSDLVDTSTYTNYKITKLIELNIGESVSFKTYARQADTSPMVNTDMSFTLDYEAADMSLSCSYCDKIYSTTEDNSTIGFGYSNTGENFSIIYEDEYNNLREKHDSFNPTCTIIGKTAGIYCLNVIVKNEYSGEIRDENYNILVHIKAENEDNLQINTPNINVYQSDNIIYQNIPVTDNIFLSNDKLNYSMNFSNITENDNFTYSLCVNDKQKSPKNEKYYFDSFDHLFYVASSYKDINEAIFIYPLQINIINQDSVTIRQDYFCPDKDKLDYNITNNNLKEEINNKKFDINVSAYYIDNERFLSLDNITMKGKHTLQIEYSLDTAEVFLSAKKDVIIYYKYPVFAYSYDKIAIDDENVAKVYISNPYRNDEIIPEINIISNNFEIGFEPTEEFFYIYNVQEGNVEISVEVTYFDGSTSTDTKILSLYYENQNSITFDFVEGKYISVLLNSDNIENLTLPDLFKDYIKLLDFFSLDENIVKVEKDDNVIKLIPVAKGTTTVIGTSNSLENYDYPVMEGDRSYKRITGSIEVTVLEKIPEIGISIKKENNQNSTTSFCIGESLVISVNSNNFNFSDETTYEWYLDSKKISENSYFSSIINTVGKHIFELKLNDVRYDLSYDVSREIAITEESLAERTLSLNYEGTIYCVLGANSLRLNALIDGYENSDYKYLWSYDGNVLSEEMQSLTSILLIPKQEGQTELTVVTDIGINQPKILTYKLIIVVESVKDIKIVSDKDITIPGSTAVYHLLVNGHKVVNTDLNVDVKNSKKEEVEFLNQNNDIIVNNSSAGKHIVSVDFGGISLEKTFLVSSFNLKKFILAILPYVIIISLIVLFIFLITRFRKSPICVLEDDIKDFDKKVGKEITLLNSGKKVSINRLRLLRMKLLKIYFSSTYLSDDGIEETKLLEGDIHKVLSVLEAIIKTRDVDNVSQILEFIKKNECRTLLITIATIVQARLKAENERKEMKLADAKNNINMNIKIKKNKSAEQTIKNYREVLNNYRYSDNETNEEEDNK